MKQDNRCTTAGAGKGIGANDTAYSGLKPQAIPPTTAKKNGTARGAMNVSRSATTSMLPWATRFPADEGSDSRGGSIRLGTADSKNRRRTVTGLGAGDRVERREMEEMRRTDDGVATRRD